MRARLTARCFVLCSRVDRPLTELIYFKTGAFWVGVLVSLYSIFTLIGVCLLTLEDPPNPRNRLLSMS